MSRIEFAGAVSFDTDADDYRLQPPIPAPTLPHRRLRQALAELGPVRPLPPPPRPSRQPPVEAVADVVALPETNDAQSETVSDPDEIVRALASAAASLQTEAERELAGSSAAGDHGQDYDPPPMMIERELAARAGGFLVESTSRPSPWPGLAFGFLLSLPVGAVVYYMLVNA